MVTIPAQPDEAYYPVSALYIFPTFTRASCPNAPTYDPTRKTKNWKDDAAAALEPQTPVSYTTISRDNALNVVVGKITMTAAEAATLNLYGVQAYPTYVVAPTSAFTTDIGTTINPSQLSLQSDAIALAKSFGLDASAVSEQGPASAITYPANEARRMWLIAYKGYQLNAGLLLSEMNANGIGAPGHWNLDTAEPSWIPNTSPQTPLPINPSVWDQPCRGLLGNEGIANTMFGFVVFRTDKISVFNPNIGG